jgi:predicted PhzF superfamily epimerase YddE/YHI9
MDLCGHATLATAHCLKEILNYQRDEITFQTLSGDLVVKFNDDLYTMDFPSRMPIEAELPSNIYESLSIKPKEVFKSRDYMLVYDSEVQVRDLKINRMLLDQINIDPGSIIVTATGDQCDFVSRFFTPQASILEDPVTGSAHCSLIPFWAERLQKSKLLAYQVSERMGTFFCENKEERVLISGRAVTYSIGNIWLA